MDFTRSLLCCDEVLVNSPIRATETLQLLPTPTSWSATSSSSSSSSSLSGDSGVTDCGGFFEKYDENEDELSIAFLVHKQAQSMPAKGQYVAELQSRRLLLECRGNAVRWIVKARSLFNFNPQTAALAVSYLDRFLEKNLSLPWKAWMVELVSLACLSLAAKMEEVDVPTLLDLQQGCEGLEHAFEAKTLQRMEMNVMSALQWRLSLPTAFSFAEKAINHLPLAAHWKNTIWARSSELLVALLTEVRLLEFEPCLLGATSVCFAVEEALPVQADYFKLLLFQYVPLDTEEMRQCYTHMEALIVDPVSPGEAKMRGINTSKSPLSPSTVLYHIVEEDDSHHVDITTSPSFYLASNFVIKRVNPEQLRVCSTKRARRSLDSSAWPARFDA